MVPIKDVQGHATEFLIVRDQPSCCYSGMTTITEFVSVKVPNPGVESIMDQPITVQGKLHVRAVLESGYVLGIYRMDGEKLAKLTKPE
jgi:predicted ATP-dependent Lon-type protease